MNYFYLQFWQTHLIFTLIIAGVLGLIIGSFLNVVIYRLPLMLYQAWQTQAGTLHTANQINLPATFNLSLPHSHCPNCQHQLHWWENIPLISYIALKGHCLNCKQYVSIRYPLIELLTALLSIYLTWHYGFNIKLLATLLFTWILLTLAFIDLSEKILPDILTISLLWLGLLCNLNGLFTDISSAIIGAIVGYLFLWIIAFTFHKITHKEGLGLGDCKLLAAIGAWLGWQLLPMVVLIASLLGTVIGITLIALNKLNRQTPIPFGPYLAIAGWISLLWGSIILKHYLFSISFM